MNYEEAVKEFEKLKKEKKVDENYIAIQFEYGQLLLVPHTDGMKIIDSLKYAESLSSEYDNGKINPLDLKKIYIHCISPAVYKRYKIAELLGITLKEVIQMEETLKEHKRSE